MSDFSIQENVPLAPLTTIGLGGDARFFARCTSVDDLRAALGWAQERTLPVHVLSGGSNSIFSDDGYQGLLLHMQLTGVTIKEDGQVMAAAGEVWDSVVQQTIAAGLAGFENLSGIPGSVGATPIQNVGAYGQEVAQTITNVEVMDRATLQLSTFSNEECAFGYRTSRFKSSDMDRYIVTKVVFRLRPGGAAMLAYPQLRDALSGSNMASRESLTPDDLELIRNTVLSLRRAKSMVVDKRDPHSRSCGSFFVNPVISEEQLADVAQKWQSGGGDGEVPTFIDSDDRLKRIPAAWLIEQAGYPKGFKQGGIGISENHNLALVNYDGTTAELLALADSIVAAVQHMFGLELVREPVLVA